MACLESDLIEFAGSFIAERIGRATLRAALLATLAEIALGFVSLGFLLRAYGHPMVGLVSLGIILLTYFGQVTFLTRPTGGHSQQSRLMKTEGDTSAGQRGTHGGVAQAYTPLGDVLGRWLERTVRDGYVVSLSVVGYRLCLGAGFVFRPTDPIFTLVH